MGYKSHAELEGPHYQALRNNAQYRWWCQVQALREEMEEVLMDLPRSKNIEERSKVDG